MKHLFDVIVIGGGHAGSEAAYAVARAGGSVALVTKKRDQIGVMSCNPAIGGLGKGHLVREIDALGGLMGIAADYSGIQFRLLNRSKGPAVQGPRTQSDRGLYREAVQNILASEENITIVEGEVVDIHIESETVRGVELEDGKKIGAISIILTTGTFLNGLIRVGEEKINAGRIGDFASNRLAKKIKEIGLNTGRLKTGTPARLSSKTINWSLIERQKPDEKPTLFSFLHKKPFQRQISCGITYTNKNTHEIIRENIEKSAIFNGSITSNGPRYCPSIEDKIHRFSEKDRHQIFVEPEGLNTVEVYVNGFSTSMPEDVQYSAIKKIPGFENVKFFRPGYAIEYDYFPPTQLTLTLETKIIENLFFAGQINGTTGYEEAAAQGLIAGINAALKIRNQEEFILDRSTSYIGVMIDDLITKGVTEPYRMFTSRAEYRLTLRADNADQRLTDFGINLNLVKSERKKIFNEKKKNIFALNSILKNNYLSPNQAKKYDIKIAMDGVKRSCLEIMGQRKVNMAKIRQVFPDIPSFPRSIENQVVTDAHYMGYLDRQDKDIESFKKDESVIIPEGIDYEKLSGLSNEIKSKLLQVKPKTLGQAIRIDGVTPAAIIILLSHIKKLRYKATA